MAGSRTSQLLALRLRLAEGDTWRRAARGVGLAASTAYDLGTRIWPSLRGRRPRIARDRRAAIERAILEAGDSESYRRLARRHGVSADTISRFARAMIEDQCRDLPPVRQTRVYRCEGCGQRVTVSPCVYCRAKSYAS